MSMVWIVLILFEHFFFKTDLLMVLIGEKILGFSWMENWLICYIGK